MRYGSLAILFLVALAPGAARAEHTLLLPLAQEPGTLDPQLASSDTEFDILRDLLEGLVVRGPDGRPQPGAAAAWETSDDRLTWTFHLRPGGSWSDGTPLTAADFVYSFRREVDPKTAAPFAETLTPIAGAAEIIAGRQPPETLGVAAPDPATLRISLAEPTPWLLELLGNYSALPVPRQAIERHGEQWARPGSLVGNGAYTLQSWVPYGGLTLARNPLYRDAAAVRIAMVRRVPIGDAGSGLRLWQTGELDVMTVPFDHLDRERAQHPQELSVAPWLATDYLALDLDRGELKDQRVRRALALAIDRAALAGKVLHGGARPAVGLIPPGGFPGYAPPEPDWAALPMAERVATARRLMAEARGPDAAPLRLTVRLARNEQNEREMLAVAAMWKAALGVEAALDVQEPRIWMSEMLQRDYQVAFDGWDADYLDPWSYLEIHRSAARSMNFTDYRSADYDALLDRSRRAPDAAARMALLAEAEATLLADQAIIPLTFRLLPTLVNARLHGWQASPINIHLSRELWWDACGPAPPTGADCGAD